MTGQRQPLRVLQLMGDTDPTGAHLAGLALHRALVHEGVEVRTLALAPGRRGGLDDAVPVMAPSRRSWTLGRVVDREALWADVTLVHAPSALTRATTRRSGRPPVVALYAADELLPSAPPEGVDEVIVLAAPGPGDHWQVTRAPTWSTGGPHREGIGARGVIRLLEPVAAATWREVLTACAVHAR